MSRGIPPLPHEGNWQDWAMRLVDYLQDRSPYEAENLSEPVALSHRLGEERAIQDGVLMFEPVEQEVQVSLAGDWVGLLDVNSTPPQTSTFASLLDTPADYTGEANKLVSVNAAEDGLAFTSSGAGVTDHGALSGLNGDDHDQYLPRSGVRPMTGSVRIENNVPAMHLRQTGVDFYPMMVGYDSGSGNPSYAIQIRATAGEAYISTLSLFEYDRVTGAPISTNLVGAGPGTAALVDYAPDATEPVSNSSVITNRMLNTGYARVYPNLAAFTGSVPPTGEAAAGVRVNDVVIDFVLLTGGEPYAQTRADGSFWGPANPAAITPLHFGAPADGVTDDGPLISLATVYCGDLAQLKPWLVDDAENTFGTQIQLVGANQQYVISDASAPVSLTGVNRGLTIRDMSIKAVLANGSTVWPKETFDLPPNSNGGTVEFEQVIFDCGGKGTYITFDNVNINCNDLSSGIHAAARTRIINCRIETVHGVGVINRAGDVWIDMCIISQWGQNDAAYYNPARYTGIGVYTAESDVRISHTVIRWMDKLAQVESTNNTFSDSHWFNGMRGYLAADRSIDVNDPLNIAIAAELGMNINTLVVTDLPRRAKHTGVEMSYDAINSPGGVASCKNNALTLIDMYFDNCHNNFYTDGVKVTDCMMGSKASSSLNSSADASDPTANTPYNDAPTIDYWFKLHAYEADSVSQFGLTDFNTFVTGAARHIVKWTSRDYNAINATWAANTNTVSNDPLLNAARTPANSPFKSGNNFTVRPFRTQVFDGTFKAFEVEKPDWSPMNTLFRGMGAQANIGFADDNTAVPPTIGSLGDKFAVKSGGDISGTVSSAVFEAAGVDLPVGHSVVTREKGDERYALKVSLVSGFADLDAFELRLETLLHNIVDELTRPQAVKDVLHAEIDGLIQ